MIVPMSKLTILVYHQEKKAFLNSLQDIGIVHIVENEESEHSDAVSETYKKASSHARSSQRMIETLSKVRKEKKTEAPQVKYRDLKNEQLEEILKEFEKLEEERDSLQQDLTDLQKDIKLLEPWGEIDPEIIAELELKNVNIRFFQTSPKKYKNLDFGDFVYAEIHRKKNKVGFIVLEKDKVFENDQVEELNLPIKSLEILHRKVDSLNSQLSEIEKQFEKLTVYIDALTEYRVACNNLASYATAEVNMGEEVQGKVFSLTGWFPSNRQKRVKDFLEKYICYYQIEKPSIYDKAPILLSNNRIFRLFEPVTRIYSLPSYWELDPTPFFVPFFVVYFGLCLGDLGYGIMTLLISTTAFFVVPKQFRSFCKIGMILGGATIISGIALNSFFGESLFYLQGNRKYFFRSEIGEMLSFLGSYVNIDNLTVFPAMGFAIFLGFVQVLLAIVLQSVNRIRQHGVLWGFHPTGIFLIIIGILFTIGHGSPETGFKGITGIDISHYQLGGLRLGSWLTLPPQEFGLALAAMGLVLLFFFNNPDKNIFLRPLMGLWELYGFATGIVGDILSYLRLFALGLASGLLAHAFNGIAFGFIENSIFPGIIGTIVLLIFAHALNFGLAILGSFVHPLRLTFVEFYKNLDFEGGGKGYEPFSKEKFS